MANGTVIIRDRVNQKQDVADLSRDTEHANDSISAIFDKEKEQKRLQTAQLAGEISGQMTNIVTTMGDIKGLEKARSAKNAETLPAGATEKKRGEWLEKMRDSPEYQAEMKQWGIGSTSQKVAQTVGSILTGLVTGNAGQAVAGGLNPWAAQLIKKETTDASGNVDVATNAMAHAVWGAVSSQMSGGSAAAGAAGAFSGELATRYIAEKYWGADTPEKIAALGQEDREQLSLLGTLAAGLAGGMAGNSSAAATSGAVAGKNAVENNSLALVARGCAALSPCRNKVAEQLLEIGAKAGIVGLAGAAIKDVADKMTSDELDHLVTLEMMGNDEITGKYLNSLQDKYAPANTGGDQLAGTEGTGKLENPVQDGNKGTSLSTPDQSGDQRVSNTGNTDGVPDTGGNTTITPIPEQNKDDLAYLALKGKEAQEAAGKLGFDRRIPAQKAPFNSHGQPVYYDGKNYITPDIDSHNVTNGWKMFNSKGKRIGTYDSELNRIKD
ncbi:VENN motif pre-toxin domain-containing protein [Pantoea agglomerans]